MNKGFVLLYSTMFVQGNLLNWCSKVTNCKIFDNELSFEVRPLEDKVLYGKCKGLKSFLDLSIEYDVAFLVMTR